MGSSRYPDTSARHQKYHCSGTVIPESCHITKNRDNSVLIIAGTDLTLAFIELIYNSVS